MMGNIENLANERYALLKLSNKTTSKTIQVYFKKIKLFFKKCQKVSSWNGQRKPKSFANQTLMKVSMLDIIVRRLFC